VLCVCSSWFLILILDLQSRRAKSAPYDLTCCHVISLRHAWSIGLYRIWSDTSCSATFVKIMSSSSVCIQALCIAIVVASSNAFLSVRPANVRFLFHLCGQQSLILGIEFLNLLGTIEMSWLLSKTLHGIYRSREDSEPPRWGKQPCDISAYLSNLALISELRAMFVCPASQFDECVSVIQIWCTPRHLNDLAVISNWEEHLSNLKLTCPMLFA
jgi:hypothetical protein